MLLCFTPRGVDSNRFQLSWSSRSRIAVLLRVPSIDNLIRSDGKKKKKEITRRIGHWHRARARAHSRIYLHVCIFARCNANGRTICRGVPS